MIKTENRKAVSGELMVQASEALFAIIGFMLSFKLLCAPLSLKGYISTHTSVGLDRLNQYV